MLMTETILTLTMMKLGNQTSIKKKHLSQMQNKENMISIRKFAELF